MNGLTAFERVAVGGILLILTGVMFLFIMPASYWFSVTRLDVRDAQTCKAVTVDYERTISRPFNGEYRSEVDIYRVDQPALVWAGEATEVVFDPERVLPDPITLEWFVGGDICDVLGEGEYRIRAFWTVNAGEWFIERHVRRDDRFHIGPIP